MAAMVGKFAMKAMKAMAPEKVSKGVCKAHLKAAGSKKVAGFKKDADSKGQSFIPRELRFAKGGPLPRKAPKKTCRG